MKLIDLTGQKIGRLIVLEYVGNTRWKCLCDCGKTVLIPAKQQRANRPDNYLWTYNGETLTLPEWAARIGITQWALHSRIRRGWSVEKILTKKLRAKHS